MLDCKTMTKTQRQRQCHNRQLKVTLSILYHMIA